MILYIDPGTGSMLFTILLGILGAAFYFIRDIIVKIKFRISGGKADTDDSKLPIVIFSDHKRYWNVFGPICDELEKREQKAVFMTASEDDPALDKGYKYVETMFIGEGNKAFSKLNMLKAYVVLSTTPSLDVFQWKRSRDVDFYVHIPHAASDITAYRMFGIDYYDAILLSGKYQGEQIRKLESLRGEEPKEIEYVGIPFMDEMKKRLDSSSEKHDKSEKTVLLAPSWGKSGILYKYGKKLIDALIGTGYNIVIRPHPQSYTSDKDMLEALMKAYPENDHLSWNKDNDNFDILNKSDILISDFSGVFFDYTLVFDKPIIYTEYEFDKSPYDSAWLDEEMWTFEVLPTLGRKLSMDDIDNIKEVIDSCIDSEEYKSGRDKAREETWMYQGQGTTRTVDYIINKYRSLKEGE